MTPRNYNGLNEMLARYSELSARLVTIEADVNRSQIAAARPMLPDHANTKAELADIEAELRKIAIASPELFPDDKRTHNTPFGSLSFRKSSYLEIGDEEKTVLRILVACRKEADRAAKAKVAPLFTEETLLRTIQEPNREALEKLTDAQLASFDIERKTEEKFTVKPLEVKADKLVKKAQAEATKPQNN